MASDDSRSVVPDALADYRRLLERGYTEAAGEDSSGPVHGDRGAELDEWMARVAQPWFDEIERLAAEDGVEVKTYQGFDMCIPGSTPCAKIVWKGSDGEVRVGPGCTLIPPSAVPEVAAARLRRG